MMQIMTYLRFEQCQPYTPDTTYNSYPVYSPPIPRNDIFYYNMSQEVEINMSTDNLIQTARVVLPKRFLDNTFATFQDAKRGLDISNGEAGITETPANASVQAKITSGQDVNLSDDMDHIFVQNIDNESDIPIPYPAGTITGAGVSTDENPLYYYDAPKSPKFMRGDMITIWLGYMIDDPTYDPKNGGSTGKTIKMFQKFRGYIASVNASDNIELLCEDFMWYFKQLRLTNKNYDVNPTTSNSTSTGAQISYSSASSNVLSITSSDPNSTERPTKNSSIVVLPNSTSNPKTYSINTLNGIIYDVLNNTINDADLQNKGIYPLIYTMQNPVNNLNGSTNPNTSKVPKPFLCFANNPIYSLGNIIINKNANLYTMFDTLKSEFNQNTYIWQQSVYNWTIDSKYNIPYDMDNNTYEPWAGNYINLGFDRYIPNEVYQPNTYSIYLNGPNSIVTNVNLTYKRKEDFLIGAYVKTSQMVDEINEVDGTVQYLASDTAPVGSKTKKKQKTYYKAVHVGDFGGSSFTYLFNDPIKFEKAQDPVTKKWYMQPSTKKDPNTGLSSQDLMAKYGLAQLAKVHYTGYYGSFTMIGYPFVNMGDIIDVNDPLSPEREGKYMVKAVISRANTSVGMEQEIFLGEKVY